jgi:hypothetical protein
MQKEGFDYENLGNVLPHVVVAGDACPSILEAYDGVELFHPLRKWVSRSTDTRRVVPFVVCEGLGNTGLLPDKT